MANSSVGFNKIVVNCSKNAQTEMEWTSKNLRQIIVKNTIYDLVSNFAQVKVKRKADEGRNQNLTKPEIRLFFDRLVFESL